MLIVKPAMRSLALFRLQDIAANKVFNATRTALNEVITKRFNTFGKSSLALTQPLRSRPVAW